MSKEQFLSVKVGEVMTKKVICIDTGMTAFEVARLIAEHKVEGFPVVEKETPIGIVTGWDLLTKVVAKGLDPKEVKVKEIMTSSPITCSSEQSVLEAAKLMAKYGIKRIPVVKEGKVIGILTPYDIIMYRRIIDYADFSH
jgi:CBS domain-containing protein